MFDVLINVSKLKCLCFFRYLANVKPPKTAPILRKPVLPESVMTTHATSTVLPVATTTEQMLTTNSQSTFNLHPLSTVGPALLSDSMIKTVSYGMEPR